MSSDTKRKALFVAFKLASYAGAVPLVAGVGTVLSGGLSAAFKSVAFIGSAGALGGTAIVAGGLLAGVSAVGFTAYAMNKGWLGKFPDFSGIIAFGLFAPIALIVGGALGTAGSGTIARKFAEDKPAVTAPANIAP